ncbi:MAG: peptide deformylase [Prolixibacteraceae bacterium]|jgi:peptide deformylase|nr:peptide deformylase [Prolixibacteraceae bacterium]
MVSLLKRTLPLLLFIFVFFACQKDFGGLNKDEHQLVSSKAATELMELYVIDKQSDSLFLREACREVDDDVIGSVCMEYFRSRLLATVKDTLNPGVGIAAPQVGVELRMLYVQRFDKPNEPFEIYYNPVVEAFSDSTQTGNEGCLSVPGYMGDVERAHSIQLSYLDSLGTPKKEEINGFTAVIFQHEIDHINGVLYYDHISGGFGALEIDDVK